MEDIDTNVVNSLFAIKKNQLKLVERRGYNIERERALLSMTLKDFINSYVALANKKKQTLRQILTTFYENENGDRLVIYFVDNPEKNSKMGTELMKEVISELDSKKTKTGIIITSKMLSSTAAKDMERLINYNIQVFLESEMGYDPTEHYLTPQHILLNPDEQRKFLVGNDINIDQLPIILDTDIISRYYGFRVGQVIKINRVNLYNGMIQKSIGYRAVKQDK